MTNEHLCTVNRVLQATFGVTAPVAVLDTPDNEFIITGDFTIGETTLKVKSLAGGMEVAGFSLGAGPDADTVKECRHLGEVILALVENIARQRAESELENIGLDEYVRELAEDEKLAAEYYREQAAARIRKLAERLPPTTKTGPNFEGPLRPGS